MRLHRETMLEFADAILSGRLAPGARLPKETALTTEYEISRGIARESMRALEERGLNPLPEGLTPHSMRRTFISLLLATGEDVPYVMSQVAHADHGIRSELPQQSPAA